jgi:hypothetical protein
LEGQIYSYSQGISSYEFIIFRSTDLQPFSGVWRPDLAGPKFLGEFPAREGRNSTRAANYRTEGKEIDLSDLACSCWEFRRAYLSLLLLYLGAILSHTLFFHLYSRSVHLLY